MTMNPWKEHGPRRWGFYHLLGYYSHRMFCEWVDKKKNNIQTVLEVGCGYFEFYSYYFKSLGMEYTGLDIRPEIIEYRHSLNPEQEFICDDFDEFEFVKTYDLVCSHMFLSGLLGMEKNLKLLKRHMKVSNRYGFAVLWSTDGVDKDEFQECLKSFGCKEYSIFDIPTRLSLGQPQQEIIIHWER